MSLILAIEPDRRQAANVGLLVEQLRAELVIGESADEALAALGPRVPDLVLTSQLLLPRDEAALAERLRELGAAGAHVQTLVIPVLRGEEKTRKKKIGGLLGRLRRASHDEDKGEDGCDPAVFSAEITEYLARGAVERAALAAAQADLEAAWAEQPAAAPPIAPPSALRPEPEPQLAWQPEHGTAAAAPAATPLYATVDVHPDMVIEDPEALFGEFAAIPIKRAAVEHPRTSDAGGAAQTETPSIDGEVAFAPAAPPETSRRPEEEWEEIALDADEFAGAASQPTTAATPTAAHGSMELTSEAVDLDDFVRELHTVKSSANAQPMIPVVDLSHVLAGDIDLPEPVVVDAREQLEEERSLFAAEVLAVFSAETVDDSPAGPAAEPLIERTTEAAGEAVATVETAAAAAALVVPDAGGGGWRQASIEGAPLSAADGRAGDATERPHETLPAVAKVEWPAFTPPEPMPTPTWEERPQADWRAAIDALPPPPSPARPAEAEAPPEQPGLKAGWQDMLSAIRRDIKSLKTDDAPAPADKPKPEFNAEPLVFPSRPAVAASVLSEFDAHAAQRGRGSDENGREAERLAQAAQDRARAAEEALRAAAAAVEASRVVAVTQPLPVDPTPSIFDARIDTDLAAVAFQPTAPLPVDSAPSIFDATIDTSLAAVAFEPIVSLQPSNTVKPVSPSTDAPAGMPGVPDLTDVFFATPPPAETTPPAVDRVADEITALFAATQPEATTVPATPTAASATDAPPPATLDWLLNSAATAAATTGASRDRDVAVGEPATGQVTAEWTFTADASHAHDSIAGGTAVEPTPAAAPVARAVPVAAAPPAPRPEPPVVVAAAPPAVPPPSSAHGTSGPATDRQRPGKGKKKRKPGHAPAALPVTLQPAVPEWGFFDPQRTGFAPLLARLNRASADPGALPHR